MGWLVGEEGGGGGEDEDLFDALAQPGAIEMLRAFNAIPDARVRAALLALAQEMRGGRSGPAAI